MKRYVVLGGVKNPIDTEDDRKLARQIMADGGIEAAVIWEMLEVEGPNGQTQQSWVALEDRFPAKDPSENPMVRSPNEHAAPQATRPKKK